MANKNKSAKLFFEENNVTVEEAKKLHEYLMFLRFRRVFERMKIYQPK